MRLERFSWRESERRDQENNQKQQSLTSRMCLSSLSLSSITGALGLRTFNGFPDIGITDAVTSAFSSSPFSSGFFSSEVSPDDAVVVVSAGAAVASVGAVVDVSISSAVSVVPTEVSDGSDLASVDSLTSSVVGAAPVLGAGSDLMTASCFGRCPALMSPAPTKYSSIVTASKDKLAIRHEFIAKGDIGH